MRLSSESIQEGAPIPTRFAFGKYNPTSHVELSENVSPQLAWSELPAGARSVVVICADADVPTRADDVNQEGRTVPATLPRAPFYHWVIVDLDPAQSLEEGVSSAGVTPRGKAGPEGPLGSRQGVNSYVDWFAGDASMAGDYYGYDGPCPPWNDEIVHHYTFTAYALDVERLPVEGRFGAPEVLAAMEGHVLASASIMGTYHIWPKARDLR